MKGFTFLGIIAVAVIAAILAVANGCATMQKAAGAAFAVAAWKVGKGLFQDFAEE